MSNSTQTGAGSRPMTDGAADNIGAGEGFSRESPNHAKPAPAEQMRDKRSDAESVKQDDSAPLGATAGRQAADDRGGEPPEDNPGRSSK